MPKERSKYGPGQNPNSKANLVRFKPGESGNPSGRPSNGPIITPALRRFAEMRAIDLLNLPQAEMEKLTVAETIALAYVCESMQTGFERSRTEVTERLDGKLKSGIELTGKDGGPVEVINISPPEGA